MFVAMKPKAERKHADEVANEHFGICGVSLKTRGARDALAPQMLSRPVNDRVVFINADDTVPFDRAAQPRCGWRFDPGRTRL